MDYVIENASAIMQLCFGFGFLVLVGVAVRCMLISIRILKKVDDLSDLVIEYIQKPLKVFIHIYKTFNEITSFFKK